MARKFIFGGSYTSFAFEAETIAYMNALGIADDSIIYYPSTPQQITGNGIWIAVNDFVLAVKLIGWSKFITLYPIIGGSVGRHKFNLINPLDSDVAYRASFVGGWTHSGLGALPNGINTYADTFLQHSSTDRLSNGMSYYSGTNITENKVDCGVQYGLEYNIIGVNVPGFGTYTALNSGTLVAVSDTNSLGLYTANRRNTTVNIFKNGSKIIEGTVASSLTTSTNTFYFGAFNAPSNIQSASKRIQLFSNHVGLTDSESVAFRTAVQNLQITLNRAV